VTVSAFDLFLVLFNARAIETDCGFLEENFPAFLTNTFPLIAFLAGFLADLVFIAIRNTSY
jgi:hypothetical protein